MAGTFQDELLAGLRSAWCTVLQVSGNFLDALPDPLVDSGQVPIARLNRWLYRQFCNREPPAGAAPPFTGGQCPFNYTVNTTFQRQSRVAFVCTVNPPEVASTPFVLGPISGLVTQSVPGGQALLIVHGPGGTLRTEVTQAADSPDCPGLILNYSITSVVPAGGVPDTCGDPPPVTPPPEPGYNDVDIDIEYSPDFGPDITIPVNFIFAPVRVNIRGEATIPIDIDVGNVDARINGEFNLNTGDITFNFGNRNYPPSNVPKPPDYRPDDDLPDPPPDVPDDVLPPSPTDPEPDTTRIIRAVIVTSSTVPNTVSTIIQNDNPDILAPNLGYVQFAIAVGRGVAWTTDIPVKNQRHFIPCPWEGGALAVRGTPRPGVSWTLTPVYLEIETPLPLFT